MEEKTISEALSLGIEAHRAGDYKTADRYYTAILKVDPKHADANHNMGVLAVGLGKIEEAVPFFKTALEANGNIAQFWLSYIDVLIRTERHYEAITVFDQAKRQGAVGDGFDKVQKVLFAYRGNSKAEESLSGKSDRVAQKPSSSVLVDHTVDQALRLAERYLKEDKQEDAKRIYTDILNKFPKNSKAIRGLSMLSSDSVLSSHKSKNPSKEQLQSIAKLYKQGLLIEALKKAQLLAELYPNDTNIFNLLGAIHKDMGHLDLAVEAFKKVVSINPDFAAAYFNMGVVFKGMGEVTKAIEAYHAFLSINSNDAEGHRQLSALKKFQLNDPQINTVEELLKRSDFSELDRCHLHYAYAKMKEDLGDYSKAFDHYVAGGNIRKSILAYDFSTEMHKFLKYQNTASEFNALAKYASFTTIDCKPIFIIGMPRSGTTLVEQIISSHSKVTGAGELDYVSFFGSDLALGQTKADYATLQTFREKYLQAIFKVSNNRGYVTDKMPHNFRFIALICSALPEAKIIHVKRDPRATCWSNFKHFFTSTDLAYSCNILDTVNYYNMYQALMSFWYKHYGERIYTLSYEELTENQEVETRKLLKHLGLNWENDCLSPHNNDRSVHTASKLQVRQKIYRGSSEAWRHYEEYLDDVFKELKLTDTGLVSTSLECE